ncbi:MAG: GIY-YIG nuclease family protein [Chloroflexi bacterium]|nr:MAG: GIY-YIG nuclease family protein [Chloroflexota bacterium]
MKYVYLIESISNPSKTYIGTTTNFTNRLKAHNTGRSPHTSRFKPWKTIVVIKFSDNHKAKAFEKYLKSGSGHAFAKRHFW